VNIGLGKFASVLNADKAFSGRELLATTLEELVKVYKIDKKPAKKIIKERNKAMAYMHEKPRRRSKTEVSVSPPFRVEHRIHVEYVPGRGLKGLPTEWRSHLEANNVTEFISPRRSMSSPPLPTLTAMSAPEPETSSRKRDSKRLRKDDTKYDHSIEEISSWTREQVQDWLVEIDLPIFIPEFETARINGRMLMNVPFPDLLKLLHVEQDKLAQKLFKHITLLKGSNKRSRDDKENYRNSLNIELRSSLPASISL